jgi:N-acetylglucosamine-6-sulfatase
MKCRNAARGRLVLSNRFDPPFIGGRVTRLALLALVAQACGGSSGTALTPAPTPTPGPPPSIVFVLTDDLDMQSMPYMPKALSLIARQGVTFTNSFVATSICAPSRATILTGQFAHNHGILANVAPRGGYDKFYGGGESSTIATWLKAAGYRTILLGKYLNGYPSGSPTYVPPGWDDWHADFNNDDGAETGLEYYDYFITDNGVVTQFGQDPADYLTDVLAQRAVTALKQVPANQPFFMYLAARAPHVPAIRAPRHDGLFASLGAPRTPNYDEGDMTGKPDWLREFPPFTPQVEFQIDQLYRDRLGCLQSVDEMIAQIVQELDAEGRLANTYVVLASDNGFLIGPHRFPHGKEAPYEESIRVPLLVRGPGVPAGQTRDALVQNVDYAPTIAEWARANAPELDGRSLAGLLRTGSVADWRSDLLLEHWQVRLKAAETAIPDFVGLRTNDYTYVEYATGEAELYDIHKDSFELSNQYGGAPATLLKQLSDRVAALKSCRGAPCR